MNFIGDADAGAMLTWLGFDEGTGGLFPGFGPGGAATFALDLEDGYSITWRWPTSIIKTRSGKEQRASRNDRAKESYEGRAYLFGQRAVDTRAVLARSAAQGSAFLLGLPHEALSMRLASSGTTVYVHTTERDWMNPGQRAVCVWRDPDDPETVETQDVTIQSTTADTITVDTAPGNAGQLGAEIMPAMAVYLEPEQAFPRWRTRAESWQFQARAALFDFAMTLHSLDLGPVTAAAGLENATVTAKTNLAADIVFKLVNEPSVAATGELSEEEIAGQIWVVFAYLENVTTIGDMVTALQASTYVVLSGATNLAETLTVADESLDAYVLSGGATQGPVGTGVTVETYASHPVWTFDLDNDGEIIDSIHALTEVIDHGGVPYAVGSADQADWGRTVIASGELGADFQWLKLFMATIKGPAKAFWLSTRRDDLPFVSKAAGTVTVSGDVGAWFPSQRQHIEIVETSGTITRAEITVATNNGNGTYTLTIGTTLATSDVERVSWLELVRFTRDEFTVEIDAEGWTLT